MLQKLFTILKSRDNRIKFVSRPSDDQVAEFPGRSLQKCEDRQLGPRHVAPEKETSRH